MAQATRNCRVCGKPYPVCGVLKSGYGGPFRWQEVACSPECGAIYFEQVRISRMETKDAEESVPESSEEIAEPKASKKAKKKAAPKEIEDTVAEVTAE